MHATNGVGNSPESVATNAVTPNSGGATPVALSPTRLLDAQVGIGLSGALSPYTPGTFQVTGRGGVPSNAVAVTGNLTVTAQTNAGYIFLGPNPRCQPDRLDPQLPGRRQPGQRGHCGPQRNGHPRADLRRRRGDQLT